MNEAPIILVEDDEDDRQLFCDALREMEITNEVICFDQCLRAYDHLKSMPDSPFIIFCDINIPPQTGLEFKRKIDADEYLRSKSIPFVFFSTSTDKAAVNRAYKELTVQGFFKKPASFGELKSVIRMIVDYWRICQHPNS